MFCTELTTQGMSWPATSANLYLILKRRAKLPFTIGKSISDYAAQVIYSGSGTVQIPYTEALFIDYRHFDQVYIHSCIEGNLAILIVVCIAQG